MEGEALKEKLNNLKIGEKYTREIDDCAYKSYKKLSGTDPILTEGEDKDASRIDPIICPLCNKTMTITHYTYWDHRTQIYANCKDCLIYYEYVNDTC